jgi:hypothetical protein
MSHGNTPFRGEAALTFWPGQLSCGGDRNPCPVRETHLERARRIAFYLTRRHRRGTPEYRYRLTLEYDIFREVLRGRGVPGSPPPRGQSLKGASELQPDA